MKKWLQTSLVVANLALLPSPTDGQVAPYGCEPICCNDLHGLYIGINGGFLNHSFDKTDAGFLYDGLATYSAHDVSWLAGVQVGYDWQWGQKLVGLVYDFNLTDTRPELQLDTGFFAEVTPEEAGQIIEGRMRWISTIRARFGLTLCDTLFYLTAGAALADQRSRFTNDLAEVEPLTKKRSRWGWTVGFGSEFVFCHRWSLFGEVLYTRIKPYKATFSISDNPFKFNDEIWLGRIGLNFRFSFCSLWGR